MHSVLSSWKESKLCKLFAITALMNPQQPQPIWAFLVETFNEYSGYATIMQSHSADSGY